MPGSSGWGRPGPERCGGEEGRWNQPEEVFSFHMEIAGYVASGEGFFDTPCCINCNVEEYCAFPNADKVLGVDRVYEKKVVDIGEGILISEPVIVERELRAKQYSFHASLSHQGILAIYSYDGRNIVQFTDLLKNNYVDIEIGGILNIAFYDDKMILLALWRPLRKARVDNVFKKPNLSVFKRIGDVDSIDPDTDTSLLHSRRTLCYRSTDSILYEYDVDTKVNKRIRTEQKVGIFCSLLGIDCGMKAVFLDEDKRFTYALGWNNKLSPLHEIREECFRSIFVSSANPKEFSKSVFRYNNYLVRDNKTIRFRNPIEFDLGLSVVRVYKDIFLLYDVNTRKWVLCRIIIP